MTEPRATPRLPQELIDAILDVANRAAEAGVSQEAFLAECANSFEYACEDSGGDDD